MNPYLLKRILEELPHLSNNDLQKLAQEADREIARRSMVLVEANPLKHR